VRLSGGLHFENGFQNTIPPAFERSPGRSPNEVTLVPLPHIFGSDELSVHAPSVESRSPRPYIALNTLDAERLQTVEGDVLQVRIGEQAYDLPVIRKDEMPEGLAGIPYNLPPMAGIAWPAKGILTKAML
jgi:NADH-quinone oxidoreductase subunit G